MIKICFFGDSICFGQGMSLARSWVCRIAQYVYELGMERGILISAENYSINGNTTRMALERMPYDIQSKRPEILIIQFGMNDSNYWLTDEGVPRVSEKAFAANLEEMIARARVFGTKRILLNTNHPSGKDDVVMPYTSITYQQSNARYNEIIRSVAAGQGEDVTLVDMEAAVLAHAKQFGKTQKEYLLDDLIHLDILGHDVYYEHFLPYMMRAIDAVLP